MKTPPSKPPLRELLQRALNARETTLRNGSCKRKDFGRIRVTMALAEQFLKSYPFASDVQVRQWCLDHPVSCIVPGNMGMLHWRLTAEPLQQVTAQAS